MQIIVSKPRFIESKAQARRLDLGDVITYKGVDVTVIKKMWKDTLLLETLTSPVVWRFTVNIRDLIGSAI